MGFFNSPVQDAIEKATSTQLVEADWATNMEIWEMINRDEDGPKDALKTIKSQLKDSNPKVVLLTLTLLDSCLKNCNAAFLRRVIAKDFQEFIRKRVTHKQTVPMVRDRLLELIEAWMESFRTHPDGRSFEDTYEQLKAQGVRFPERELSGPRVPVVTPPARPGTQSQAQRPMYPPVPTHGYSPHPHHPPQSMYPGVPQQLPYPPPMQYAAQPRQQPYYPAPHGAAPHGHPPPQQAMPPHAQRRKLLDDIAVVRESITILSEALNACNVATEDVARNPVIAEFATSCKQMRPRVTQLIEQSTDEALLADMLIVLDHLNRVLDAYEAACRREPIPYQPPVPPSTVDNQSAPPPAASQPAYSSYTTTPPAPTGYPPQPYPPMTSGAPIPPSHPTSYTGYSATAPIPSGYAAQPYTASPAPIAPQPTPVTATVATPAPYAPAPVQSQPSTGLLIDLGDTPTNIPPSSLPPSNIVEPMAALGLGTDPAPAVTAQQPQSYQQPQQPQDDEPKLSRHKPQPRQGAVPVKLDPPPRAAAPRRLSPVEQPVSLMDVTPIMPTPLPSTAVPVDDFDFIARRHQAAPPAAVPPPQQAAPEDDDFAALANRHRSTSLQQQQQQQQQTSDDDGFSLLARRNQASPTTPQHTSALASPTTPQPLLGTHQTNVTRAKEAPRKNTEYMAARSDDMFDL